MLRTLLLPVLVVLGSIISAQASPAAGTDALQHWSDSVLGAAIAKQQASGLVIAIVKNGQIVFEKGYGAANPETHEPVNPSATQFRIGSVSKSFTATAIVQLKDRNRIASLDDPANKYLRRLQLPRAFGKEITIRDLLSHKAGFQETYFAAISAGQSKNLSAEALRRTMPPVVRQPGHESVYSNYGYAIAGLLVEDVTGQTIDRYFQKNIFEPLGMSGSEVLPMNSPKALGHPASMGANGKPHLWPTIPMNAALAPAGGVVSTGTDMAHYMIAHLHGSPRIPHVTDFSLDEMHNARSLTDVANEHYNLGFLNGIWNGHPIAVHTGSWPGFQSVLLLLPDEDMGIFVSVMPGADTLANGLQNGPAPLGGAAIRDLLLAHFLGPYHPPIQIAAPHDLTGLTGLYRTERRPETGLESLFSLLAATGETVRVTHGNANGTLHIGTTGLYKNVANNLFWNDAFGAGTAKPSHSAIYRFQRNDNGRMQLISEFSIAPYTRVGIFGNPFWQLNLLKLLMMTGSTGLLCVIWLLRGEGNAATNAYFVALGALLLLLGLMLFTPVFGNFQRQLVSGNVAYLRSLTIMADLAVVLSAFVTLRHLWGVIGARYKNTDTIKHSGGLIRRAHYAVLQISVLLFAVTWLLICGFVVRAPWMF